MNMRPLCHLFAIIHHEITLLLTFLLLTTLIFGIVGVLKYYELLPRHNSLNTDL